MIEKISDFKTKLQNRKKKSTVVVAAIDDKNVMSAVLKARDMDLVDIILIGNKKTMEYGAKKYDFDLSGVEFIYNTDPYECGIEAVKLINDKKADILMNGQESYLGHSLIARSVVDKQHGIKTDKILSHIALFELKNYHKILGLTDNVMNISPDLNRKARIISNAVNLFRTLGLDKPKVAVLGAVEVVNPSMPVTMDAALLSKMAERGQIKNCTVEGPLGFDNAISKESAERKGIVSEIAGDPDILLAPSVETSGIIYQSLVFLTNAKVASIGYGASVPIVLTSKLDTEETRLNSLLLACNLVP